MIILDRPVVIATLEADRKIYAIGRGKLSYWLHPESAFVGFYGIIMGVQPVRLRRYAPFLWDSHTVVIKRYKGIETEFLEKI